MSQGLGPALSTWCPSMSVVIIEPEGGSGEAGLRGVTGEENNKEDLRQTDRQTQR